MRFNSIKTLIEFCKFMEGVKYIPSIPINDIPKEFSKLRYISCYSCLFEHFPNVVILHFYNKYDKVKTIVFEREVV